MAAAMHVAGRDFQVLTDQPDTERGHFSGPYTHRVTRGGVGLPVEVGAPPLLVLEVGCPPATYRNNVINTKLLHIRGF